MGFCVSFLIGFRTVFVLHRRRRHHRCRSRRHSNWVLTFSQYPKAEFDFCSALHLIRMAEDSANVKTTTSSMSSRIECFYLLPLLNALFPVISDIIAFILDHDAKLTNLYCMTLRKMWYGSNEYNHRAGDTMVKVDGSLVWSVFTTYQFGHVCAWTYWTIRNCYLVIYRSQRSCTTEATNYAL